MSRVKAELGKIVRVKNSQRTQTAEAEHYNVVILEKDGGELQLMFTDSDLEKASVRSKNNPEDQIERLPFEEISLVVRNRRLEYLVEYWRWKALPWWSRMMTKEPKP